MSQLRQRPGKRGGDLRRERISMADVDQKIEVYQKMSGKSGQKDSSTSEAKAAVANARMQIV